MSSSMRKRAETSPYSNYSGDGSSSVDSRENHTGNTRFSFVKSIRNAIKRRFSREASIRFRLFRASYAPRAWYTERTADVVILSYPKCGRTWLRIMLGKSLALHYGLGDVNYLANDLLAGTDSKSLRIRVSHDDNPHWKEPARLSRRKGRYRRQKVVFLVRDPRDVVVSMYFERSRREQVDVGTMGDFLEAQRRVPGHDHRVLQHLGRQPAAAPGLSS